MELRHLRYFAAVARTLHFGRAAEQLHMAQPPLSQAIRQLEAELGVTLFHRTTRQVTLTTAGAAFQRDVGRILIGVEDAVARAQRIADGHAGVLRMGFTGTATYELLPRVARTVTRELPDVALEFHTDLLTPAQEEGLRSDRLDVGVLRPPVQDPGLATRTIAHEPLVAVLPEDHPLADLAQLEVAQLQDEPFVTDATERSVVDAAVVRSCAAAGFRPRSVHQVEATSILLALVAGGLGVALVPASVRTACVQGVVFRDVADAESVELALAYRRDDTSPLLARLLDVLVRDGLAAAADGDGAPPPPPTSPTI